MQKIRITFTAADCAYWKNRLPLDIASHIAIRNTTREPAVKRSMSRHVRYERSLLTKLSTTAKRRKP